MAYLSWGKRCLDGTYKYQMAKDTLFIECQFGREWGMVIETRETVSEGEALEIVNIGLSTKE